jgi:hypothetical protein
MTLPQVEAELSSYLGNCYKYEDWSLAFDAVMKVEGDTVKAQNAIQQISAACEQPHHLHSCSLTFTAGDHREQPNGICQ